MTRPIIPPKDPIPDSTVSEIHALYREGAGAAEPGPSLDRAILAKTAASMVEALDSRNDRDCGCGYRAVVYLARLGAAGKRSVSSDWRHGA